jgi:hypothetical protein
MSKLLGLTCHFILYSLISLVITHYWDIYHHELCHSNARIRLALKVVTTNVRLHDFIHEKLNPMNFRKILK